MLFARNQSNTQFVHEAFNEIHHLSRKQPLIPLSDRKALLLKLRELIQNETDKLIAVLHEDFSHRPPEETRLLELFPILSDVKHQLSHLKKWTKPRKVKTSIWFQPAKGYIIPQALGVVGIIAPWNYPLYLAFAPLAAAIAAGNRVMIKMSEFTPKTGELVQKLLSDYIGPEYVIVITGEVDVAKTFAEQPFDHLLFTGSTEVGRSVMKACAENLTPVTLELGGKSPIVISDNADLKYTAEKIIMGKCFNAGQTCIAPDYVLSANRHLEALTQALQDAFDKYYPESSTKDYCSIISTKHHARLDKLLQSLDADTTVIPLRNSVRDKQTIWPHLVINPKSTHPVMQEEIFGPILPIITTEHFAESIQFIQARPRPLALYYFGQNKQEIDRLMHETHAGGVTLNDTILHVAQENLPFGGIGPSGMGHYHGKFGFDTFSKLKPVFKQSRLSGMRFFYPPYKDWQAKLLQFMSGR